MDRAATRESLGIGDRLPFSGVNNKTAYEITWLDRGGKPQIAIAEFRIGADSPSLVESKSVKLYLGSFAQERMGSPTELARTIEGDLARACGTLVSVALMAPDRGLRTSELHRQSIASLA